MSTYYNSPKYKGEVVELNDSLKQGKKEVD